METKICKCCGKELTLDNFTKSKILKDGYENKCKECRNKARLKYECTCVTCGKIWLAQNKGALYCSPTCKPQSKSKKMKSNCAYCGKEIYIIQSKIEKFATHYCSIDCKNKHYGETHTGKNSARYNRVNVICDQCGKEYITTKYEYDKYNKHFCSLKCKNELYKTMFSGENNPNYNPNKAEEERDKHRNIEGYQEWIRKVFDRDNYTCQCCGDGRGGNLNAHHIKNYTECKELRTSLSNGITLCKKCHMEFHNQYGYKHNNANQLFQFLNDKQGNTEPSTIEI